MILKITLRVFYLIYIIPGVIATPGTQALKETKVNLPNHLKNTDIKPPLIALVSHPHSVIVHIQYDEELWREYGSHLDYKILLKKGEEDFKMYNRSHLGPTEIIEDLKVGAKYCVKVAYLVYHKELAEIEPSNTECVTITEFEKTRQTQIASVTVAVVILLSVLIPSCLWIVVKNQQRLKQALRPPLSMPYHIREFLMDDFDQPQPQGDSNRCRASEEESWDTISVVTLEQMEDSPAPETHFVLGGTVTLGPGEQH